MLIILCRHAQAEPGDPDAARELAAEGHEQARELGERLAGRDDVPGALVEQWAALEELFTSGRLAAPEPEVFRLEEAAAAVASLENRTAKGKVVLRVR